VRCLQSRPPFRQWLQAPHLLSLATIHQSRSTILSHPHGQVLTSPVL